MCEISYKDIAESLNEYNIIDIRWNFAFSIWTLDWAINILDENFAMIVEEWSVFPKNKKILIMCRIGNISNKYAQFLRKQWYDAYSLEWWYMKYKKDYLNK
jgi:rhodanese-related sulfurtransferase